MKFFVPMFLAILSSNCFASDWVLLHDDPEMIVEWDRGNIHAHEGRMAVRERITWKKEQVMDNGIKFKFSIKLLLYSCKEKTESLVAVSNFSADRKLVYKANIGPIVQGPSRYNDVERMLKHVC